MRERASRRKQMHNLGTARDQPVRDVEAVAIGRVTLGAHDADAVRAGRQGLRGFTEARGLHVLLVRHLAVTAKACVATPAVRLGAYAATGHNSVARRL